MRIDRLGAAVCIRGLLIAVSALLCSTASCAMPDQKFARGRDFNEERAFMWKLGLLQASTSDAEKFDVQGLLAQPGELRSTLHKLSEGYAEQLPAIQKHCPSYLRPVKYVQGHPTPEPHLSQLGEDLMRVLGHAARAQSGVFSESHSDLARRIHCQGKGAEADADVSKVRWVIEQYGQFGEVVFGHADSPIDLKSKDREIIKVLQVLESSTPEAFEGNPDWKAFVEDFSRSLQDVVARNHRLTCIQVLEVKNLTNMTRTLMLEAFRDVKPEPGRYPQALHHLAEFEQEKPAYWLMKDRVCHVSGYIFERYRASLAEHLAKSETVKQARTQYLEERQRAAAQRAEQRAERARQAEAERAARLQAVRSGKVPPGSVDEAVMVLGAEPGLMVMQRPLVEPDGRRYFAYGQVERAEGGQVLLQLGNFKAMLRLDGKTARLGAPLRVRGLASFLGRYVGNMQIPLVSGASLTAPVFQVSHIEGR